MKLTAILFVILFLGFGIQVTGSDNRNDVRFTISLEKSTYFVDEPVYLEMLATNISNHEVAILDMVTDASWGHFRIILEDDNGQPVDRHDGETLMYSPPEWPGYIMAPGESWILVKDLLSAFGKWGDSAHQISLFLPPGNYTVQVIYHTNPKLVTSKNPEQEDKQTLDSNVLKFEVIEPSGEEQDAHKLLIDALAVYNKERKQPDKQILLLKQFIAKYPNSVYNAVVYFYLYSCYTINSGYTTERLNLIQEMLAKFPNNGLAYHLLSYDRREEILSLARASTITKPAVRQKLKIASATSRASFYAQCLVDMQRIGLRTAERMKQVQEKR